MIADIEAPVSSRAKVTRSLNLYLTVNAYPQKRA
jgi:hypothetical protein